MEFKVPEYDTASVPPGTLIPPEEIEQKEVRITLFDYTEKSYEEKVLKSVDECAAYVGRNSVTWINVDGLSDAAIIDRIGELFGLHPLALEDVLTLDQRPKIEDYDNHTFALFQEITFNGDVETEQLSIFIGSNFVITFQEKTGDVFDPIRERIRQNKGIIRKNGSDYLAYCIIDALVDSLYPVLEDFGEKIEKLEEEVVKNPDEETVMEIRKAKRDMLVLRKAIWPCRNVLYALQRGGSPIIKKQAKLYLRDSYDHIVQIMDMLETYREVTTEMMSIYVSTLSKNMNEVMKVLTIISTIFIPLTFLTGIYGMNFKLPEFGWGAMGYVFFWVIAIAAVVIMLVIFRRKKWL